MAALLHLSANLSDLKDIEYPITFLQFLAERIRSVLLSTQGKPIKKRSIEQYLRLIGQIFASMEGIDPCHNRMEKLDFWLGRHLESYQK